MAQHELDLFDALNVSEEMRGVSQTPGSHSDAKAWKLHSAFDHVQVPEAVASQLLSRLKDQLHAEFVYRQHRKTVATLLSINAPGKMSPWLRITSNTKLHKLFIYYHIREDNRLHEKIFSLRHGDNWTHVGVSFNGTKLTFFLDCKPPDKQQLAGHVLLNFPLDSLIYFRQEPGFKKKLLGSVEVAKVSSMARKHPTWHCRAPVIGERLKRISA